MVSFGQCSKIILLYKSAWGIKTTEILIRINILNKGGHAGTLNSCEQTFVIVLQYFCPLYYTLNPEIKIWLICYAGI